MKPIVFLDFDGVLNSENFYRTRLSKSIEIDFQAVSWLNDLVQDVPNIGFVISSTWRMNKTIEELQSILDSFGFTGEVISKTKDLRYLGNCNAILRGNEIYVWINENADIIGLKRHEYRNYVIFDDDSDMLLWQKDNFIHIDPYFGLSPHDIFKAKRILNHGNV